MVSILKHVPHDLSVLEQLRPILIELSDLNLCATLFQQAFDHYQTQFPTGHVSLPSGPDGAAVVFDLLQVLVLADLYNTTERFDQAIQAIRRGCRWLQGRASEKFWDALEDDREWDIPTGAEGKSIRVVGEGEVQPGMHPLDINARHRLAIARIKSGEINEGKVSSSESIASMAFT